MIKLKLSLEANIWQMGQVRHVTQVLPVRLVRQLRWVLWYPVCCVDPIGDDSQNKPDYFNKWDETHSQNQTNLQKLDKSG